MRAYGTDLLTPGTSGAHLLEIVQRLAQWLGAVPPAAAHQPAPRLEQERWLDGAAWVRRSGILKRDLAELRKSAFSEP